MHVKLLRLGLLVLQGCCQIKAIKFEIKYIETLEAQQVDQVRILKGLHDQQRAQCREFVAH